MIISTEGPIHKRGCYTDNGGSGPTLTKTRTYLKILPLSWIRKSSDHQATSLTEQQGQVMYTPLSSERLETLPQEPRLHYGYWDDPLMMNSHAYHMQVQPM